MNLSLTHRHSFKYEHRLFRALLIGTGIYWCVVLLMHLKTNDYGTIFYLQLLALVITGALLYSQSKGIKNQLLVKIYCLMWLPLFIVNWKYYGGMDGPYSYAYFTIIVVFLGLLEVKSRLYMVLTFCLINILLTLDASSGLLIGVMPMDGNLISLAVYYLVHSAIVAAIVVYIKVKFDREREEVESKNQELDQINAELSMKHELLTNQQRQIKRIQNNLEELVHERTIELESKNKELQAYAYDNAHLVRRPLSNILSLLELLNSEKPRENQVQNQLMNIQKNANELDEVVMKINMILK